jgi:hypothetical protein
MIRLSSAATTRYRRRLLALLLQFHRARPPSRSPPTGCRRKVSPSGRCLLLSGRVAPGTRNFAIPVDSRILHRRVRIPGKPTIQMRQGLEPSGKR